MRPTNDLRVVVVQRPDYDIAYEQIRWVDSPDCPPSTFWHSNVRRWSPAIRRQYAQDVATLRALRGAPLFAIIRDSNDKLKRFTKIFGGQPVSRVVFDGIDWEIWRLD